MTIRPALGCGTCIHWHVLGRIDIPCNGLGASFPAGIMSSLTHFSLLEDNVSLISSNSARLCMRYGHVSLKSLEVECEACGPACGGMPDSLSTRTVVWSDVFC